jgi:kynureninase
MSQPEPSPRFAAVELDREDPNLRDEFVIPTKAEAWSKSLPTRGEVVNGDTAKDDNTPCTYLVGNSLGLQPKRTATRIQQHLDTWATQGVQGHFKPLTGTPLPTWLNADERAAEMMAPIVGADKAEVAVMQTLTANLHFLMSAFYKPDPAGRHKIILEAKAFPSDHFLVETQIRHHGLTTDSSMVLIEPPGPKTPLISTAHILSVIEAHAQTTALILLPGIQYYTGQLLDIPTITAFAHKHNIFIIWDLAHAVGNVPLSLHDWNVDAAAWCTYKYLNSGPGGIAGLFVHSRHSQVATSVDDEDSAAGYRNRLAGWWGNDKKTRFVMANKFHPASGAAGFQISNPSVLDITSLSASLEVFALAGGMAPLRAKSERLTGYLEGLLGRMPDDVKAKFRIITSSDPKERGAQLSLMLDDGLLEGVMDCLEEKGVFVDDRKPNVIRVAPAPLYNTFEDCFNFVEAFGEALKRVAKE